MRWTIPCLAAGAIFSVSAPCARAADLLKVTILNDSDAYSDDRVYVQMLGKDAAGTGKIGHVDLATSTWKEIAESDNTVEINGRLYTEYARKLSELTREGLHTFSFRMPHIISGRVYISFEHPTYFHINPGPALEEPSAIDTSLPNYHIIFDKIELDWENAQNPFLNTTTVDYFSISFMLGLKLRDGTSLSRGFTKSRGEIMADLKALPDPWRHGMVHNGTTAIRFVAPNKLLDAAPFADYFDSYVASCWSHYATHTLSLASPPNAPAWTATGKVVGGGFTFTAGGTGETVTINNLAGHSDHIFGCDGAGYLFTTGSDSIAKQGIIKTIGAALNRGVVYDGRRGIRDSTTWWHDATRFYTQQPTNLYAKVLHDAAYQGFCYGFSFDDVGDFSTGIQGDAAEAVITIQAMHDTPVSHTVHIRPDKTIFSRTDSIEVLVDVTRAISIPFYPGFYLITPSGQRFYLTQGNRLASDVSAYVNRKEGREYVPVAMTIPGAVSDIRLFSASFRNVAAGDYVLQGGAVDARTPIVNGDINWITNAEDTEVLRVR